MSLILRNPVRNPGLGPEQGPGLGPRLGLALALLSTLGLFSPLALGESQSREINLRQGKAQLLTVPGHIIRAAVGQPRIADVTLVDQHTVYLVGQGAGQTNLLVWQADSPVQSWDVAVERDLEPLRQRLRHLFPHEQKLEVSANGEAIVLAGEVQEAVHAEQAVAMAQAYLTLGALPGSNSGVARANPAGASGLGGAGWATLAGTEPQLAGSGSGATLPPPGNSAFSGPTSLSPALAGRPPAAVTVAPGMGNAHVINLLTLAQPAQIRVEVKVAEVSRVLLEQLGSALQYQHNGPGWSFGVLSNLLSQSPAAATFNRALNLSLDGQRNDALVKILAEPTLLALSGHEARFLAGGKVFIPTSVPNGMGGTLVTLTEQEYGVSLRFMPKVMEGGRIWMSIAPEVSEVNPQGINISSGPGLTPTILPSFTTRSASTTVELHDGEHFLMGGLLRNNSNANISAMPFLGEIPLLGALFRSPEFQSDRTELVFVVTPHRVEPSATAPELPTANYQAPSFSEQLLQGHLEHQP